MTTTHNYTLADCKDYLYKAQALASEEKHERGHRPSTGLIPGLINISDIDMDAAKKAMKASKLLDYLLSLDEEQIDIILAVMYIGRDHVAPDRWGGTFAHFRFVEENDPFSIFFLFELCVEDPEEYLWNTRAELAHLGWDKYQEIDIMYGKRPVLSEYLRRGFYILGLM